MSKQGKAVFDAAMLGDMEIIEALEAVLEEARKGEVHALLIATIDSTGKKSGVVICDGELREPSTYNTRLSLFGKVDHLRADYFAWLTAEEAKESKQ